MYTYEIDVIPYRVSRISFRNHCFPEQCDTCAPYPLYAFLCTRSALLQVLTAEYPAYFRLAIALGHPLPYQRLLDLDNSSGPPSIED